jgi:hypothetical protein
MEKKGLMEAAPGWMRLLHYLEPFLDAEPCGTLNPVFNAARFPSLHLPDTQKIAFSGNMMENQIIRREGENPMA